MVAKGKRDEQLAKLTINFEIKKSKKHSNYNDFGEIFIDSCLFHFH